MTNGRDPDRLPPNAMLHLALLLCIVIGFAGCQATPFKGSSKESGVDTQLAQPSPAVPTPQAAPEEHQPGFDQESPKAQSL